jgi:quercetin dioxygenase-like cupin family protein
MRPAISRVLATLTALLLLAGCAGAARPRPEAPPAGVQARELVRSDRSWDGRLLPPYPTGPPEITIRRITIPAGARLDLHSHPVINAGVLLSGQLTVVTSEGKTLELREGDPIVEVVGTPHHGLNRGRGPAEIIVFYAGAPGLPLSAAEPR